MTGFSNMDRFDWWVFRSVMAFALWTGIMVKFMPTHMSGWAVIIWWACWLTTSALMECRRHRKHVAGIKPPAPKRDIRMVAHSKMSMFRWKNRYANLDHATALASLLQDYKPCRKFVDFTVEFREHATTGGEVIINWFEDMTPAPKVAVANSVKLPPSAKPAPPPATAFWMHENFDPLTLSNDRALSHILVGQSQCLLPPVDDLIEEFITTMVPPAELPARREYALTVRELEDAKGEPIALYRFENVENFSGGLPAHIKKWAEPRTMWDVIDALPRERLQAGFTVGELRAEMIEAGFTAKEFALWRLENRRLLHGSVPLNDGNYRMYF